MRVPTRALILPIGALALAACNAMPERPAPTQQIRAAESAVIRAEQTVGRTAADVRIAREKLTGARQAVEQEHMELAERAAEQAQADAELAIARFEADRAREASTAVERTLQPQN